MWLQACSEDITPGCYHKAVLVCLWWRTNLTQSGMTDTVTMGKLCMHCGYVCAKAVRPSVRSCIRYFDFDGAHAVQVLSYPP